MNNKKTYTDGIENIPLRQIIKTLPCMVFVINLRNKDEIVKQTLIDLGNPEDRKWLGRITAWAVTNHHSIETMSQNDAVGMPD